ncbi:hypothetical protein [Helicobacter pylori]|uniref:hypothetical protein n=1 Tax=Helicobacter pylori TaxID=210 RepID=UPI0002B96103|nr:hypothetical protein [Helicobacter pylori]
MFKANALKTKKYHKTAFKSVYWQQENFQKDGNVGGRIKYKSGSCVRRIVKR